MGKKRVMVPAEDLDLSAVKYEQEDIHGNDLRAIPHVGFSCIWVCAEIFVFHMGVSSCHSTCWVFLDVGSSCPFFMLKFLLLAEEV